MLKSTFAFIKYQEPYNTQKKNDGFYDFFNFDPHNRVVEGLKASHSISKTVRNVLVLEVGGRSDILHFCSCTGGSVIFRCNMG